MPYRPDLPLFVGVDYGATGFGAAVVAQLEGPWQLRLLADYELEGGGGAREHAENILALLRSVGFEGDPQHVNVVGGPDTDTTQTGSGQRIADYFRTVGFLRIKQSTLRGPDSVDRGITVVCTALRQDRIAVSPRCQNLISRFPEYRWPVERATNTVRGTHPVHNDASHIMDALRYLVTEALPRETLSLPYRSSEAPVPVAQPRDWDRDVPPLRTYETAGATIVGPRRDY